MWLEGTRIAVVLSDTSIIQLLHYNRCCAYIIIIIIRIIIIMIVIIYLAQKTNHTQHHTDVCGTCACLSHNNLKRNSQSDYNFRTRPFMMMYVIVSYANTKSSFLINCIRYYCPMADNAGGSAWRRYDAYDNYVWHVDRIDGVIVRAQQQVLFRLNCLSNAFDPLKSN